GDLGQLGAGDVRLSGMGARPPIEEAVPEGERAVLVAGAADLRVGSGRAAVGRAEGARSARGSPGDARGAKTLGQAPGSSPSQGVPCRDMSIKSAQLQNAPAREVPRNPGGRVLKLRCCP